VCNDEGRYSAAPMRRSNKSRLPVRVIFDWLDDDGRSTFGSGKTRPPLGQSGSLPVDSFRAQASHAIHRNAARFG
jgi:hypothetical protein